MPANNQTVADDSQPWDRLSHDFCDQFSLASVSASQLPLVRDVTASSVSAPAVAAVSETLAAELGMTADFVRAHTQVWAGNVVPSGMRPHATAYAGHQFGHWAGQLGDGRAIGLGEWTAPNARRYELQLKGAGRTPFSRRGDGRAVLRSSVREFLCSEAMHALGVPTTRALCLVRTGDAVLRDMFYDGNSAPEPGAIVCRVAPSFLRFGHVEWLAARADRQQFCALIDWLVQSNFLALPGDVQSPRGTDEQAVAVFGAVCSLTAELVAAWQSVGFVHGVLNTDNMSLLGLTIDYGPYGWLDAYEPDWTPNTTDAEHKRYRFSQQPAVCLWNLQQLAAAFAALGVPAEPLRAALQTYVQTFETAQLLRLNLKLGWAHGGSAALRDVRQTMQQTMQRELFALLAESALDMTGFFRRLSDVAGGTADDVWDAAVRPNSYAPVTGDASVDSTVRWKRWLQQWNDASTDFAVSTDAQERRQKMRAVNPSVVLRNFLAQEVIDRAHAGDDSGIAELLHAVQRPFDDAPAALTRLRPAWALSKAGCSALSCSS